ncbi:MAG: FAD:protein FMN transferase [Hyphomonadaceae bacterium]
MPPSSGARRLALAGETMGTSWSLVAWAPGDVSEAQIGHALHGVFARAIAETSLWEPDSWICRFNALAAGEALAAPSGVQRIWRTAVRIAEASNGAFDPCLGAVSSRRGFIPAGPAQAESRPGRWREVLEIGETLIQPGGVMMDLNAIAKGDAVDRMAAAMNEVGVASFLVEIGGEFVGWGATPEGLPWWVDIEPVRANDPLWRAAMSGWALATSGGYRRMRDTAEGRISHIVPAREETHAPLASVSVFSATCMEADAWATALYALGGEHAPRVAEKEGLLALFQFGDRPAVCSSGLAAAME